MLKKNRCVCDIEGNMQKAVLFFIFCVLLCEVSPKVPVRKEDLLNKKQALSKQLSPNVPKWEDIAYKLHTKDKPSQNKSKTLMNLLKVVSAKEIDVPDANGLQNDTITNPNLNNNATHNQTLQNTDSDQNKTIQNNLVQNNFLKNNPFRRIKLNNPQANATVAKTPKKYAANETIGAKLAFFLLKNAINSTKEKPNNPEIVAPTMIPIFKPMPSSTRNTIPQPLANELIRKDNFVPKELNPQQLKDLDNIELNPNVFNPMQNKAVLNPLLASEAFPKETISEAVNLNGPHQQNTFSGLYTQIPIENKENVEQGMNPTIPLQNGLNPQIRADIITPSNNHLVDLTLNYVDPQIPRQHPNNILNYVEPQKQLTENIDNPVHNVAADMANNQPAQEINATPVQILHHTINGAVANQLNKGDIQSYIQPSIQHNGPQYELKISPELPRNANTNAQTITNGNLQVGLNPKLVPEQLNSNFETIQFTPNHHVISGNQNDVNRNSKDLVNQRGFPGDHNGFAVKQQEFTINQNTLQDNNNVLHQNSKNLVNQHGFVVNQNNFAANQNDLTLPKNGINSNPMNIGDISSPNLLNQKVDLEHVKVNSMPKTTGFNLPCLKASDVLEDFGSAPNCCQKNKPILNSITESPKPNLQCEKPILVGEENNEDESVAIVFKPKNISLLKFYGDLLKKITLTVLVPYHISKLTSS